MVVKTPAEKQTSLRHLEPEGAYNKFQKFRKSIYMLVHRDPLTTVQQTMAKRERSYFKQFSRHKNNNLKLFAGTHQTMIGSEKSTEHRQRNEKICRTHR